MNVEIVIVLRLFLSLSGKRRSKGMVTEPAVRKKKKKGFVSAIQVRVAPASDSPEVCVRKAGDDNSLSLGFDDVHVYVYHVGE
jgi:hypothetical protein